jgi:pimeloyl-ACP methyl ester carboxylesterase
MAGKENDVTVNGINIHYIDWQGKGKPIVCLHGLTPNCRYFDSLGERLTPDYRLIAYDLRGRGNSDKPASGYNFIRHGADIEGFLDALSLKKVMLVGHSMGAGVAAWFTPNFPERVDRLILIDGGGAGAGADYDALRKQIEPVVARLSMKFPTEEDYIRVASLTLGQRTSPQYAQTLYKYDAFKNPDGTVSAKASPEAIEEDWLKFQDVEMVSGYARTKCPVLLLRAPEGFLGDLPILPRAAAEMFVGLFPNCKLVDIEGTDHASILLGEGDATSEAIKAFLKE